MTRCRNALVAAVVIAGMGVAQAQPALTLDERELGRHLALADHFYRREQFYRAIGVLEELRLFAPSAELRSWAGLRIALAYHHGAQYPDAIAAYDAALGDAALGQRPVTGERAALGEDVRGLVLVQRALARAEEDVAAPGRLVPGDLVAELEPLATSPTTAGFHAAFLQARVATLAGDRTVMRRAAAAARAGCERAAACPRVDELEALMGAPLPRHRSPLLGVTLSLVVPGLGSVYSHHHVDGLYYGGITALAALGAYSAYDRDRDLGDQRAAFWGLATTAGLFYLSGLVHAHGAARRFNAVERQRWQVRVWRGSSSPLPLDELQAPGGLTVGNDR
jgi:hypothetical protein